MTERKIGKRCSKFTVFWPFFIVHWTQKKRKHRIFLNWDANKCNISSQQTFYLQQMKKPYKTCTLGYRTSTLHLGRLRSRKFAYLTGNEGTKEQSTKPRHAATVSEDPEGARWHVSDGLRERPCYGVVKAETEWHLYYHGTDHKGRQTGRRGQERAKRKGGGRRIRVETRAVEITDLPDDNPPWWRPRAHMVDPHVC